jgi:hypothetical protein
MAEAKAAWAGMHEIFRIDFVKEGESAGGAPVMARP